MGRGSLVTSLAVAALAGSALGQTVFTQWDFNTTAAVNNNPAPSTGHGVGKALGMTNSYNYVSPTCTGSITNCDITATSLGAVSSDPATGNTVWRVRGWNALSSKVGWNTAAPQLTQGAEFDVSTVNYSQIHVTFDWGVTNQGVRNGRFQYSTDGGHTWTNLGGVLACPPSAWLNGLSYDLSAIPAANDNPNFRARFVSVYDPDWALHGAPSPNYTGASGGVYGNSSGNWQFDMVSFSGTPIRTIPPSGTGAINYPAVCSSGGSLTFTVQAVDGVNPTSNPGSLSVHADLSGLGLSATAQLYDDGTHGDAVGGDGTFTLTTAIGSNPLGNKPVAVTISDTYTDGSGTHARSGAAFDIGFVFDPVNAPAIAGVVVANCSTASSSRVVVSQAFGGGGHLGATAETDAFYDADYIQLYNRSALPVNVDGWSVQYAGPFSTLGFDNPDQLVPLSGTLQPGQSLLIQMGDEVPGFAPLPTPDFKTAAGLGGVMGNTGGRIALVRSTTLLGTDYANPNIEDFLGYGNEAVTFEGAAPAATPGDNTGVIRNSGGAQDTNQNFNDFGVSVIGPGVPLNRASNGFLAGYASESVGAACAGDTVTLTSRVFPGSGSTGIQVHADVSPIVGSPSNVQLYDDGSHGDLSSGDGTYTLAYAIPGGAAQGVRTVGISVTDLQGHSDHSTLTLMVGNCSESNAPVVVSQIYGGGNHVGDGYNTDFIEIFNRSSMDIDLDGPLPHQPGQNWSVQFGRPVDTVPFPAEKVVPLHGVIRAGEYRLIITQAPGTIGAIIPPADFQTATNIGMDNQHGQVAVVSSTSPLGADIHRADLVDLVGYGPNATAWEGVGPTSILDNATRAQRRLHGCQDNDQSAMDFDVTLALSLPHNSASPAEPCSPLCPADLDNGSGAGLRDGGIDINDLLFFLTAYEAGDIAADLDDGSGAGVPDEGVDINDLLFFLTHYEAGC